MATSTKAVQTGLYLYGITMAQGALPAAGRPGCPAEWAIEVPGVENGEVEQIVEGSLAAIVTRVSVAKIRPRRANLAAHHGVLCNLTDQRPILPIAFGTISSSEEQLRKVLCQNHNVLDKQLKRLLGKVEMGLSVYWETPNIFEFFVATYRELEEMRDRLFRPGRTPTFEEKVGMGKRFESLLLQNRQRHTRQVIEALSPYCVEIRAIDPGEEKMIMKLACLVEEGRRRQWEDGIEAVARHFDHHYCFKCSGPWAPHNFADVNLELE